MKKYSIKEYIIDLFIGIGFIILIFPVFLYWLIHGSYDRYLWLIHGPEPFSNLGSGPFQMYIYIGAFVIGVIVSAIAIRSKLS